MTQAMTKLSLGECAPGQRWKLGFRSFSLEDEFVNEVELKVEGTVPDDVAGTMFRAAPSRHQSYGKPNGWWYQGDGMVHAVRFEGGRVWYRNRFVGTEKFREEQAAGGLPLGRKAAFLREIRRRREPLLTFNPANTNPVVHAGELFALAEFGRPYRLDATTLETVGEDDLGCIPSRDTFFAHPKLDPTTGELWGLGVHMPGPKGIFDPTVLVTIYCRDSTGRTKVVATHPLPTPTLVHDIALTRTKVVIAAPPLTAPRFPVRMMFGLEDLIDGLCWDPRVGTKILVVDRVSGDARSYETGPFWAHHVVNGFDDGDDVIVDHCPYPDQTAVLRLFREPLSGTFPAPGSFNQSCLERMRLKADGGVERRLLASIPFDWPKVAPRSLTSEHRWVYGATGYFGGPVAVDTETSTVVRFGVGVDEYAEEPLAVPKASARSDTDVWLLYPVLGESDVTEIRIFDGADLEAPPVARVYFPHAAPFGYHGSWLPTGATTSFFT